MTETMKFDQVIQVDPHKAAKVLNDKFAEGKEKGWTNMWTNGMAEVKDGKLYVFVEQAYIDYMYNTIKLEWLGNRFTDLHPGPNLSWAKFEMDYEVMALEVKDILYD